MPSRKKQNKPAKPRPKKQKKSSELDSVLDQVNDSTVADAKKELQNLLADAKGDSATFFQQNAQKLEERLVLVSKGELDQDDFNFFVENQKRAAQIFIASRIRSGQAIVFFQQLAHTIVRQSIDVMIVASRHVVIVDERVNDRFFGRLHNCLKDRIEPIVGNCFNGVCEQVGVRGVRIRGGKGDEQIARTISGNASRAGETERRATGEAFQLVRQKRRISRNDDDNGADFLFINLAWNFFTDWNSRNGQLGSASAIRLHKDADDKRTRGCILVLFQIDLARRGSAS